MATGSFMRNISKEQRNDVSWRCQPANRLNGEDRIAETTVTALERNFAK
jgi:hypothetical protein